MSRLCRLEEGLLSLAAPAEEANVAMNQHNLKQHELSLARQAASLSRTRGVKISSVLSGAGCLRSQSEDQECCCQPKKIRD